MTTKLMLKIAGAAVLVLILTACGGDPESVSPTPVTPILESIDTAPEFQDHVSVPLTSDPTHIVNSPKPYTKFPTPMTPTPESIDSIPELQDKAFGQTSMTTKDMMAMETNLNTIDLAIEIKNDQLTVVSGQQVIYKISIASSGPNPASEIRVIVELPDGISYDSDTAACDAQANGRLLCDLGHLFGRGRRDFLVAGVVDADLPANSDLTMIASVENIRGSFFTPYSAGQTAWPDPDPENNSTANTMRLTVLEEGQEAGPQLWTVPIHLQEENNITDLTLHFWSSERDGFVTAGMEFDYEVFIVNGSRPARDVRMSIDLPQRATYQPNGEDCVQDAPYHLVCVIGELKINGSAQLSFQMLSDDDLGEGVDGIVTISAIGTVENLAGPDLNPSDNTVLAVTRVKHDVRLREHFLERRRRGFD